MKINLKKAAIGTLIGIMAITPMTVMAQEPVEETPMQIIEDVQPEEEDPFLFTEEQDKIWEEISALSDKLYELYPENVDLWLKLYEEEPVMDKEFDEIEFIKSSKKLTESEKKTLTDQIAEEDRINNEMNELWNIFYADEEDFVDFTAEYNYAWDKMDILYGRQYGVRIAHFDIWDKIDEAFYDKYGFEDEDVDMEAFIKDLKDLSDKEKEIALADNKLINIFDEQIDILLNSIYEDFVFDFDLVLDGEAEEIKEAE